MKKHKLLFIILTALLSSLAYGQGSEKVLNYIATFKEVAMEEMQRTGVPAAITLAQGIHETGAGTSQLVISSNNHFGIKCKSDWKGEKVYHDDDARGECFRKYDNPFDSYRDHSDFLKNRPYYTALFELDPTDYKAWAHGLKKAGYATNPKYASILIQLIEKYNLQDYTMIALGRNKPDATENGVVWASNTKEKEIGSAPINQEGVREVELRPVVKKTSAVFPEGKFRINETTVIFVKKGTSFLKLAEEHNISLSRLFDFNDMKAADIAEADGLIFLQRKRRSGASEFHLVAEGETVHDIAQIEGVRLESLLENNLLKEGMEPAAGEKLYLQATAPAMPKLAGQVGNNDNRMKVSTVEKEEKSIVHTVLPKETVYAIAKKYAVAVDDVMKWNEMQTIDLKTGQKLRINK